MSDHSATADAIAGLREVHGHDIGLDARLAAIDREEARITADPATAPEFLEGYRRVFAARRASIEAAESQATAAGLRRSEVAHLDPLELKLRLRDREWIGRVRAARSDTHRPGRRPATSSRPRERRDGSKRNSSRGSPSDDPDLSDLPSHARYCRWVGCWELFVPKRSDGEYCCAAHKAKAWRAARNQEPAPGPLPRLPVTEVPLRPTPFVANVKCECNSFESEHFRGTKEPLVDPETNDCFWCGHPVDRTRWPRLADQEARKRSIDIGPRPLTITQPRELVAA
jgi:hypothetical protein